MILKYHNFMLASRYKIIEQFDLLYQILTHEQIDVILELNSNY